MIDIQDPKFYADWSEEDLQTHIKKLQAILGQKRGYPPELSKKRILEMLNPNTEDFLGTGLSLNELMISGEIRRFQGNIVNQDRDERRRRMGLIIEMATELGRIREQTRFATRLAEGAIEDVITGDWAGVRIMAEQFLFKDEHESIREHDGPIYAKFAALCQKAFDGRPGAEEVAEGTKN